MTIQIERKAVATTEDAEGRLRSMGFRPFVGPFAPRAMEECHWHRIDVVIAAVEGSFQLKDGTTDEIHTIDAGDWTLTPRGTLHAFAAESPGIGVVGYSEHIEFSEIEELPASELPIMSSGAGGTE